MRIPLLLLFIAASYLSHAQTNASANSFAFPNSNNNFLNTIGSTTVKAKVGVDLYTGTAQINVPICNLASRDLTIPVSLYYANSRGNRIQDYAGSVGLGWMPLAGGSVSRVVRCFPDEISIGYFGSQGTGTSQTWGQVIAANLGNNAPLNSAQSNSILNGQVDGEPDLFSVSTPFFSFQFVFDENGKPVFPNNTGYQIIDNLYGSFGQAPYFEVIDDKGTQYFFGTKDSSTENMTATLHNTSYTFPVTWYLDKIVTYNSRDVITFNYQAGPNDVQTHYQSRASFFADVTPVGVTPSELLYEDVTPGDATPLTSTYVSPKYIYSIVSQLGEVDFSYAFDRSDDVNAARLSSVSLKGWDPIAKTNSNTLKTFGFNYGYYGSGSSDPNVLRLRLDNITIAGNTAATSTPVAYQSFVYNSTALPSRASTAFDFWGYYNTNTSSSAVWALANKNPDQTNSLAGILTEIHDIEGGITQFFYELNDYHDAASNSDIKVGGQRVYQITSKQPSGETLSTLYHYNDGSNHSTGQIYSQDYERIDCGFDLGPDGDFEFFAFAALSESPFYIYDLNGNFVGYSSVTVIAPNGGKEISNFTNFNDFPDGVPQPSPVSGVSLQTLPPLGSSTPHEYKRGLLMSKQVKKANDDLVSETINTFASYTNPVVKKSYGFAVNGFSALINYPGGQQSFFTSANFPYNSVVENYLLSQTVQKDHDQSNPAVSTQRTASFAYAPNNRLIRSITTTDSRGLQQKRTMYHPDDTDIPDLNGNEPSIMSALVAANVTDVMIHATDNKNNTSLETHTSYQIVPYTTSSVIMPGSTTTYLNHTATRQQIFQNDPVTATQLSSAQYGSKPNSVQYGYNGAYQVAKVVNASNIPAYQPGSGRASGGVSWQPNDFTSRQTTFTMPIKGNITLTNEFLIDPGQASINMDYWLSTTGQVGGTGSLCVKGKSTSATCNGDASITFPNMPPGTYTVGGRPDPNTNTASGSLLQFTYQASAPTDLGYKEFFFESFEENTAAVQGAAHTGNAYYNGSYFVNMAVSGTRSFVVQWWQLVNGSWVFNEQPYTGPTSLPGPVDDVRVFPTDALMTTYTFLPQVGVTSETDPSGRTTYYEYDGLQRASVVRDQNKNIIKTYTYQYAGVH